MENLEQLRAANAIKYRETEFLGIGGGGVVKKVPTLIRDNGFLGALAFALDKSQSRENEGHYRVFECICEHLCSLKRIPENCRAPEALLAWLAKQDSAKLRDVTMESLLYMNYLRRFAKPGKDKETCQNQ